MNRLWSRLIIEELIKLKCTFFCIAPGSRSTPLTVAIAENKKAKKTICYDERSLGFCALGISKATNFPTVLVVTSGTAVGNLMPAIIEASVDCVPLLILSADRPFEFRESNSNQTIDQVKIFGNYVRFFADIQCPNAQTETSSILKIIDYAVFKSVSGFSGPVHINCMFREPLFSLIAKNAKKTKLPANRIENKKPTTEYVQFKKKTEIKEIIKISKAINKTRNGLLVLGQTRSFKNEKLAIEFIDRISWPVYVDIMSGLKFSIKNSFCSYEDYEPDMVLQIGGRIIEKNVPRSSIIIDDRPKRFDEGLSVTKRLEVDIEYFIKQLIPRIKNSSLNSKTKILIKKSDSNLKKAEKLILNEKKITEPFVAREVSISLKSSYGLFVSNSMPIRDLNKFGKTNNENPNMCSNRGASGIDGAISTACGFALGVRKSTVMLLGDLSFLHDINGLFFVKKSKIPMIIVVINNNGGGIFSFLKIKEYKNIFSRYFETPHNISIKKICESFLISHISVSSKRKFSYIYKKSLAKNKTCVIEIKTNKKFNYKFHKKIEKLL